MESRFEVVVTILFESDGRVVAGLFWLSALGEGMVVGF
jgi:hypothetical protein